MNAEWIITSFVICDDLMKILKHKTHRLALVSDAEVVTVALVAAKYFHNHHKIALDVMCQLGYITHPLSASRFNRRLHQLADWLELMLQTLTRLYSTGQSFIVDSMPVPVCRRVRAWRNKKVRGREFCGYCSAKKERFYGFRLHLVCTPTGVPVSFSLLPASYHDLTPIHELTCELPSGANVYGDKAYNSAHDESTIEADTLVKLVPIRRVNMLCNSWDEKQGLRENRHQALQSKFTARAYGCATSVQPYSSRF